MKNLLLSYLFFIFSCAGEINNFSILELVINDTKSQASLKTLILDSLKDFLDTNFNLIIIKNLKDKNTLDLVNKRILFEYYTNSYFISLSNNRSISLLFKDTEINVSVLSVLDHGRETKIGVFLEIYLENKNYGIFVHNFTNSVIKNLDFNLVNDQITYLNHSLDNLMLILDRNEMILVNYLNKHKFFPLILNSRMNIIIERNIDERIYSNFFARAFFYKPNIVIRKYLDDNNVISNFPKNIIISDNLK